MIKRINIYGGPGAGKTAMASYLFHQLKTRHIIIEQVSEFAKTLAYQGHEIVGFDQAWIFMTQMHSEEIYLRHGANLTITDAPLYLMMAYIKRDCPWLYSCLEPIAAKFEEQYPSIHLYVERPSVELYQQKGRFEDFREACEMDMITRGVLDKHTRGYHIIKYDNNQAALDLVLENLLQSK